MKLIFRLLLIAGLTYLLSFYMPWWIVIVVSFVVGFLLHGNGFNVFVSGFLGAGLLWLSLAWYLDFKAKSFLSEKIVALFPFEDQLLLIIAAGLIGALCGGMGALSGNSFRQLFIRKKGKSFYN